VNGSYAMPYIKGQAYINHHFSLTKNVPFSTDQRLQLRVSAYNVFNHPTRYPDLNTNLGALPLLRTVHPTRRASGGRGRGGARERLRDAGGDQSGS